MKNIHSTDEVREIFDTSHLAPIHVTEKIMKQIYEKKNRRTLLAGKRLLVSTVLAILALSTVVFAVEEAWRLKGPKDTAYSYSLEPSQGNSPYAAFPDARDSLEPGEAMVAMDASNPKFVQTTYKPLKLNSLEELSERVGSRFLAPAFIPEGYSFQEAAIDSTEADHAIEEEMEEECKTTDKKYVTRILDYNPKSEVSSYSIVYSNGSKQFLVRITLEWISDSIRERKYEQTAEKIEINGFEAVLTKENGMAEIKWLADADNTGFSTFVAVNLLTAGEDINTDEIKELVKVSESIK